MDVILSASTCMSVGLHIAMYKLYYGLPAKLSFTMSYMLYKVILPSVDMLAECTCMYPRQTLNAIYKTINVPVL
jgi:hypothetical protein